MEQFAYYYTVVHLQIYFNGISAKTCPHSAEDDGPCEKGHCSEGYRCISRLCCPIPNKHDKWFLIKNLYYILLLTQINKHHQIHWLCLLLGEIYIKWKCKSKIKLIQNIAKLCVCSGLMHDLFGPVTHLRLKINLQYSTSSWHVNVFSP